MASFKNKGCRAAVQHVQGKALGLITNKRQEEMREGGKLRCLHFIFSFEPSSKSFTLTIYMFNKSNIEYLNQKSLENGFVLGKTAYILLTTTIVLD
jgi:hypothetical protein